MSKQQQQQQQAICVTTSKPTFSLTPGGGGGSITMICPQTGSVLSSLRPYADNTQKSLLGVSSLSFFPDRPVMMAYGGNLSRKGDTYGLLLTMKNISSPPILHWKCRLPEAQMTAGIIVSSCGHYLVGGSTSGNLFIWSVWGGRLIRTVKAHYRSVTTLTWSGDGGMYLITGGADGLVHVFSLMDLVEHQDPHKKSPTINPIRTWSIHHLPVTKLLSLGSSNRFVSASEDGQIAIMEIFSNQIVARLQVSDVIRSLAFSRGCLLVGTAIGVIYTIDLDVYAARSTQAGVTVKRRKLDSVEDQVFDTLVDNEACYKGELRGHERSVTALAVLAEKNFLVSGDEAGVIRIWDLTSHGCIRVLKPWSQSQKESDDSKKKKEEHPITSITIVPTIDEESESSKKKRSITELQTPLKRFPEQQQDDMRKLWVSVPFLKPKQSKDSFLFRQPTRIRRNVEETTLSSE